MLDLRGLMCTSVWPPELERLEDERDPWKPETFAEWRKRTQGLTGELPDEVCEQWIYRHYSHSPMQFLELNRLSCDEETWTPEQFLARVGTISGNEPMDPVHDLAAYSKPGLGGKKHATAEALDKGAWDYAPIVLHVPGGYICPKGEHVQKDYLLIEGHSRHRYLNALIHDGRKLSHQRVFVLTLT
ncbi:hypothetical protein AXY46_03525 [Achromobacter xylosoxidans]|nr:hypothetical protein AXY46_03525 [Achromobacter xylosoxidans]